jgi:hypothetical protein
MCCRAGYATGLFQLEAVPCHNLAEAASNHPRRYRPVQAAKRKPVLFTAFL